MYCARGGKKTLVLGSIYGSQTAMGGLYENYPGFPEGINGIELSERILAQAQRFGAENQTEQVEKIVNLGDFFRLKTENWQYESKTIILAMGASHRQIGVPGEKELTARGISYCVHCDGALYRNKVVAVIGYGNGAARAILYLANIASRVHLISPKEKLVAEPVYLERIKSLTNYAATFGAQIAEIRGEEFVESVEFNVGGTPRALKGEGVFVEMGMKPNVELAENLGLDMTSGGFVKINRLNQETSMPGVFAAGDMTGGRMQAATAVGAGASAGISALQYLG
jgi:thioredoxin reductase (NADPH)